MTQVHETPHLELGQEAPKDLDGATYTLSSGHKVEVRYYGKNAYIEGWTAAPIEAAVLFFREVFPSNTSVHRLTVKRRVKLPASDWQGERTTERYLEYFFPFNEFVAAYNGPVNKRYYRADGSSLSAEEFVVYADKVRAEREVARAAEEAEEARKRDAGRQARLDAIVNMEPVRAQALLIILAGWWTGEEGLPKSLQEPGVGGTIDMLLTELTSIDSNDL